MLVLTRRRAESIKIGNDVVIKVIQTGRGMVRLGIDAPAHIRVLRGELAEFSDNLTAVSSVEPDGHDADSESEVQSDPDSEDASLIDFTTDYAMEIENQIEYAGSRYC